ncbi:hypothetical protein [Vibrio neptunius]|uniref:hypothetical protein n=1 Tax=Vibrio neptunius TaxID=170651 RepID=UPI00069676E2|nr:hypothetical protein [Vibrio neptunius]
MNSDWSDLKRIIGNIAGAREAFESACVDILQKKFPEDVVEGIRVDQGDGGIDIYVGNLGVSPIDVYQCKYFIDGVGNTQKDQIRKSFKRAMSGSDFQMKKWFLCIPIQLSAKETSWFNQWKAKQTIPIELVSGPKLISYAKETELYDLIFEHDDAKRIKAIYDHIMEVGIAVKRDDPFALFVKRAESDCFRLLQSIIHYHVGGFSANQQSFRDLHKATMLGDEFSACQYIKSVFAGKTTSTQKVQLFSVLNNFDGIAVAYKYIKRYEALIDYAKQQGRESEIKYSMYGDVYNIFTNPIFKTYREQAYWSVEV